MGLKNPCRSVDPKIGFCYLGCVWESLFIAYLSLSSHISTFDKNCRCLEELIKIAYDSPISHFLLISISFMEKLIKKSSKQLIRKTKIGHLNDKNVLIKNNEKNRKQHYEK